jgi:hypothetical protein
MRGTLLYFIDVRLNAYTLYVSSLLFLKKMQTFVLLSPVATILHELAYFSLCFCPSSIVHIAS